MEGWHWPFSHRGAGIPLPTTRVRPKLLCSPSPAPQVSLPGGKGKSAVAWAIGSIRKAGAWWCRGQALLALQCASQSVKGSPGYLAVPGHYGFQFRGLTAVSPLRLQQCL